MPGLYQDSDHSSDIDLTNWNTRIRMATILGTTKAKNTFAVLSLLGLLTVGAPISTVKAEILPDQSTIQTVLSPSDHSVLAQRFEDSAKEMQAKADEQKRLLEQYENNSYLYGNGHKTCSRTLQR